METKYDGDIDERKLNILKVRILELENDNIVKKESNSAMLDKIRHLIETEVEKR